MASNYSDVQAANPAGMGSMFADYASRYGLSTVPKTIPELLYALKPILGDHQIELLRYLFMQPGEFQMEQNVFPAGEPQNIPAWSGPPVGTPLNWPGLTPDMAGSTFQGVGPTGEPTAAFPDGQVRPVAPEVFDGSPWPMQPAAAPGAVDRGIRDGMGLKSGMRDINSVPDWTKWQQTPQNVQTPAAAPAVTTAPPVGKVSATVEKPAAVTPAQAAAKANTAATDTLMKQGFNPVTATNYVNTYGADMLNKGFAAGSTFSPTGPAPTDAIVAWMAKQKGP